MYDMKLQSLDMIKGQWSMAEMTEQRDTEETQLVIAIR